LFLTPTRPLPIPQPLTPLNTLRKFSELSGITGVVLILAIKSLLSVWFGLGVLNPSSSTGMRIKLCEPQLLTPRSGVSGLNKIKGLKEYDNVVLLPKDNVIGRSVAILIPAAGLLPRDDGIGRSVAILIPAVGLLPRDDGIGVLVAILIPAGGL
jgi:hypothetical protein